MRALLPLTILAAAALALSPAGALASQWGSAYGDPPGFCPALSLLPATYAVVVTNDPRVPTNPEQSTFWGIHANPGYDDWYGFWYGDFRGRPGDSSGWMKLMTVLYSRVGHWNFADYGWSVHGHAKQYIGYYNWTFGGQCGLGWWGTPAPPPYMADVYGNPVVDIYVDSVPPYAPQPRLTALTTSSASFVWDAVADRGDGAGADLYTAGLDHYSSWWTDPGGHVHDLLATPQPRAVTADGLAPGAQACVHVRAYDRLGNGSEEGVACATAVAPPPLGGLHPDPGAVAADPAALGLTGLPTWLALHPRPEGDREVVRQGGVTYELRASPTAAEWSFGDGSGITLRGAGAFGDFSADDPAAHTYQAQSRAGYTVACLVDFDVTWTALVPGGQLGPYPAGTISEWASPLQYRVEQAQPELLLSAGRSPA